MCEKPLDTNDEEPEDFVDKTPGSIDEIVKYDAMSLSPTVSPKEVSVKPCQQEIQREKVETEIIPDEPDVYHSPVSPLHYPENNSRERSNDISNRYKLPKKLRY